jgi:hypothetical protein
VSGLPASYGQCLERGSAGIRPEASVLSERGDLAGIEHGGESHSVGPEASRPREEWVELCSKS